MDCIITGVGGQGTIFASKMTANILMEKGEKVRSAETIGMAQRGGSVVSHIRTGDVLSPLVPAGSADLLLGFEPAEALRCIQYLKINGSAVVSTAPVRPVTTSLGEKYDLHGILKTLKEKVPDIILIDTDAVCREIGSFKVLNICMLGAAAAAGCLGITMDELENSLRRRMPDKILSMNLEALYRGAEARRL